jgi:hypothetical protein
MGLLISFFLSLEFIEKLTPLARGFLAYFTRARAVLFLVAC